MAGIQVLQHIQHQSLIIVPFALGPTGGAVASGPVIRLTHDEFRQRGGEVLTALLQEFYTRDGAVPSELYNLTSDEDREEILKQHKRISLYWNRRGPPEVKIYTDHDTIATAPRLPFPGDAGLLVSAVLSAFDKA